MSVLHIWPEPVERRDGSVIVAATIERPGVDKKVLWYSVPEEHEKSLSPNADYFVVGSIYLQMQAGHDVHVHGEVSPSLLRNLEEYQAAWVNWMPALHKVTIRADRESESSLLQPREEAVVAFSAGVDSCFTAFRHARAAGPRVPYHVAAGVMVHGFDIPLHQPEVFASAAVRSKVLLSSLGIELIPVATNYRSVVDDWSHSFGPAVASCLSLFAGRFRVGLIGQGLTYSESCLLHEGSNPFTDPLLSSDQFKTVPDGAGFERAAKIDAMGNWEEFRSHLRVCWQGPDKDRNCCECEKCIRNILTFRALGLGLPPCFTRDVGDEAIKSFRMGSSILPEVRYGGLAAVASSKGVTGEWVRVLEKRIASMRRLKRSKVLQHISRLPYYRGRILARLSGKA